MGPETTGGSTQGVEAHWDFFICHAWEDKDGVARPLYQELEARGHSVWLDETELTVGDSLRQCIDRGVANCRFGVVILSEDFFKKNWPQHELDGLMDRQMSGGAKVVLPVWHDVDHDDIATHSPSLANRVAANTAWGISPVVDQLVRAFTVATTAQPPADTPSRRPPGDASMWSEPMKFPLDDVSRAQLLSDRPEAWEFFLFADAMARGTLKHEPAWRDHQLQLVRPAGRSVTKDEVMPYIQQACTDMVGIVENMGRLLTPAAQEVALGPPGEAGDPAAIEHLCQRLTAAYGHCLEWATVIRSTRRAEAFDRLFELLAAMADTPISQFREFVDRCTTEIAKVPEQLAQARAHGETVNIELALVLTIDDSILRQYEKELRRLKRRWRKL